MIQSMTERKRTVKVDIPAELQSSPRNFQTAGRSRQFCSSCPERCTGWGRLSYRGFHSVLVASTLSLCLHCQRPFHNLRSWCRGGGGGGGGGGGSSTPVTVPRWCAGRRSGRHKICSDGNLPASRGAWGRQPPSSFPVEHSIVFNRYNIIVVLFAYSFAFVFVCLYICQLFFFVRF